MRPVWARSFWMSTAASSSVPRTSGREIVLPSMVIVAPEVACCAAGVVMEPPVFGPEPEGVGRPVEALGSSPRSLAACHAAAPRTKRARLDRDPPEPASEIAQRALDRGPRRADIQEMGERANLRRVTDARETCPSCGRDAVRLASGHCVHCL